MRRELCGSLRGRTNHNDPEVFVFDVGGHCARPGQSLVAVDGIRHRGRLVDIAFAKESRSSSLLALAGGIGEIPDSLFIAGQHRGPSGMVAQFSKRTLLCDGGDQPTIYAAKDVYDFSGRSLRNFHESDRSSSSASCSVAVRIRGDPFRMVRSLAADFRRHARSRAITRREVEALRRLETIGRIGMGIEMLLSRASLEPGVFGIARPVLVWPEGISERLEDAHLEAILAHELWHVRRRDNLAAAIHMMVEAIFWFHPLVWCSGARLIEEREHACDEDRSSCRSAANGPFRR